MEKVNRRAFLGLAIAVPMAALVGKQLSVPNEPDNISWFMTKRWNELMRGRSAADCKQVTILLNERWFNKWEAELSPLQRFVPEAAAHYHGIKPLKFKTGIVKMDKTLGFNQWRMFINA
jgi:hypothetical protein